MSSWTTDMYEPDITKYVEEVTIMMMDDDDDY